MVFILLKLFSRVIFFPLCWLQWILMQNYTGFREKFKDFNEAIQQVLQDCLTYPEKTSINLLVICHYQFFKGCLEDFHQIFLLKIFEHSNDIISINFLRDYQKTICTRSSSIYFITNPLTEFYSFSDRRSYNDFLKMF